MAITKIGLTTNTGNATLTTSRAPAVPTGAAAGDVAYVFIDRWNSASPSSTITPPAGFNATPLYRVTGGTGVESTCWWKRLTAADSGTYSFSWSTSDYTTAHCTLLRGVVASGNPSGGTTSGTNYHTAFATSATFPSTTVNAGFTAGLLWHGYNDSSGTHTPPTAPAGFTESADVDCATDAYYFPTSGTSFTVTGGAVTVSSAIESQLVAVQPDTGAAPPVNPMMINSAAIDRASRW